MHIVTFVVQCLNCPLCSFDRPWRIKIELRSWDQAMIDLSSIGAIVVFRFISFLSGRNKDDAIASVLPGCRASFRDEMGYWYAVRVAAIETLFPDAGNGRTRFNGCDYGRLIRNAALAIQRFGSIRWWMRAECADAVIGPLGSIIFLFKL